MIETKVKSLQENIQFRYDVSSDKDGSGSSNFTSNIEMYVYKTSIDYDNNSIITTETNKKDSKIQVLGVFKIILLNTDLKESKDVYINLVGNLNNVFVIDKIYNLQYTTTPYVMGTYINIGKVPAKINEINGVKEVEIVMEYVGNKPGDTTTLQVNAYEYMNSFTIENIPSIKITATYAILQGVVKVVDSNNMELTSPVNTTSGSTVYYLTEIQNVGNVNATNVLFYQTLDSTHCKIVEIKYGYSQNLINTLISNGNIVNLNITDNILANGGKYYVRVQAIVNKYI